MKFYDTLTDDEEEEEQFRVAAVETFKASSFEEKFRGSYQEKQIKVDTSNIPQAQCPSAEKIKAPAPKKIIKPLQEKVQKLKAKEQDDKEDEDEEYKDEQSRNKDGSASKHLLKKKRVRKLPVIDKEDVDDSKIISETSIDFGMFKYI